MHPIDQELPCILGALEVLRIPLRAVFQSLEELCCFWSIKLHRFRRHIRTCSFQHSLGNILHVVHIDPRIVCVPTSEAVA